MSAVLPFNDSPWETVGEHARQKKFVVGDRIVRLLELSDGFEEDSWCVKSHLGFVLSGEFRLRFSDHDEMLRSGDGLALGGGRAHSHKAEVVRGPVLLFLVERTSE